MLVFAHIDGENDDHKVQIYISLHHSIDQSYSTSPLSYLIEQKQSQLCRVLKQHQRPSHNALLSRRTLLRGQHD